MCVALIKWTFYYNIERVGFSFEDAHLLTAVFTRKKKQQFFVDSDVLAPPPRQVRVSPELRGRGPGAPTKPSPPPPWPELPGLDLARLPPPPPAPLNGPPTFLSPAGPFYNSPELDKKGVSCWKLNAEEEAYLGG